MEGGRGWRGEGWSEGLGVKGRNDGWRRMEGGVGCEGWREGLGLNSEGWTEVEGGFSPGGVRAKTQAQAQGNTQAIPWARAGNMQGNQGQGQPRATVRNIQRPYISTCFVLS